MKDHIKFLKSQTVQKFWTEKKFWSCFGRHLNQYSHILYGFTVQNVQNLREGFVSVKGYIHTLGKTFQESFGRYGRKGKKKEQKK